MSEFSAYAKFITWVLGAIVVLGMFGGGLKTLTFKTAEVAAEAQRHDQMSFGKFSRALWSR